ncbi:MAG: hypothetical protein Q9178_004934 [Gyalolechia marmorata]
MRFAIIATVLATMAVAAPVAEPNNPKFDWPGRMDEALEKRNNPKFDWVSLEA